MAKRRKQSWKVGDVVLIPQQDGGASPAQLIDHVMENVVGIALYEVRATKEETIPELTSLPPIAVLLTTRDLLDEGVWQVVGDQEIGVDVDARPYERFRAARWVGAKVRGSGIVRQFLDAVFGLAPWDDWADPNYLDALLLDPSRRPAAAVFEKS